ncbi:MAG: hypothetical protein RR968_00040 [Vagococcus sp.]
MRKQLNVKEQWFADTEEEANAIVEEARNDDPDSLTGHGINLKSNKSGEYYLVKLEFKYNTPAGIMESELSNDDSDEEETWADEENETTNEEEKGEDE